MNEHGRPAGLDIDLKDCLFANREMSNSVGCRRAGRWVASMQAQRKNRKGLSAFKIQPSHFVNYPRTKQAVPDNDAVCSRNSPNEELNCIFHVLERDLLRFRNESVDAADRRYCVIHRPETIELKLTNTYQSNLIVTFAFAGTLFGGMTSMTMHPASLKRYPNSIPRNFAGYEVILRPGQTIRLEKPGGSPTIYAGRKINAVALCENK